MFVLCVYSKSRNDVPRVAQRYAVVVFVVFCVHMYSFAGLIRRTPPPTVSDTAITDRHSDTIIFQLRAHWVRISWSIGSEKSSGTCGSRTLEFLRARRAPYPLGQALRLSLCCHVKVNLYRHGRVDARRVTNLLCLFTGEYTRVQVTTPE